MARARQENRLDARAAQASEMIQEKRAAAGPAPTDAPPTPLTVDMQGPKSFHEHWAGRGLLYTADDQGIFYSVPLVDTADLVSVGCVVIGQFPGETPPPPDEVVPTAPPVCLTIPYASPETSTVGDVLTCTMGTWEGMDQSTDYAYAWKSDGSTDLGTTNTYTVVSTDTGTSITCVVTATNALGSTAAPPSNVVAVA